MFYLPNELLLLVVYGIAVGSCLMAIPLPLEVIHWVHIVAMVLVHVKQH